MANRVTGAEVKEIINTVLTGDEVTPFITAANAVVTGKCANYYTEAELKEIERWFSAHLVSIRDPSRSAVTEQGIDGGPKQRFALMPNYRIGLATTPYGSQVLLLDYGNKLSDLGLRRLIKFTSVGSPNKDFG